MLKAPARHTAVSQEGEGAGAKAARRCVDPTELAQATPRPAQGSWPAVQSQVRF